MSARRDNKTRSGAGGEDCTGSTMSADSAARPTRGSEPHADRAPTYYQCPACGFLSDDPAFGSPDSPCPVCGAIEQMRRTFPTERLRRLDERIRRYHTDKEHEIVVILVAAFLEAILEDIIDRILISRGADLPVRRLVLDGERGIGGRLAHTFPKLTGSTFEEIAAELGFEEFPHEWRMMRKSRNAFIHDSPFHGPQETLDSGLAEKAMTLLDQAYRLFVRINNSYAIARPDDDHGSG
ncbi:MAG: hypothetical protein Kow0056_10900 [Coriobacteriia bacterium]